MDEPRTKTQHIEAIKEMLDETDDLYLVRVIYSLLVKTTRKGGAA